MKKLFVTIILGPSFLLSLSAQKKNIDHQKFIKETQIMRNEQNNISLAWWIPYEFWQISLQNREGLTENQIADFVELLRPFTIFVVVDGTLGSLGGLSYTSEDSIANSIVLIDGDGEHYYPMNTDSLGADIKNLLSIFKPIMTNVLGPLGENMNFYVFTDERGNDERISDPYEEGFVEINFVNKAFKWRTPLGTLLEEKKCPKDNELLNGAWKYCPWHGVKLNSQ